MKLTKVERSFLVTLLGVAQKLIDSSSTPAGHNGRNSRKRRSRADVVHLKKEIRAARRRKVPVKQIADKLGVTPAYIYQLGR
jgi:hypothetical protein